MCAIKSRPTRFNSMDISKTLLFFFTVFMALVLVQSSQACSMYKVTIEGKTVVGCNEDAWRSNSKIWFTTAKNKNEYGVAISGSRQVGPNQFAPQSAMNEAGLVFSRLASYHPVQKENNSNKKKINNEVIYMTEILQKCATVEEVANFIKQYDRSIFIEDVFIYVDSSGKYLVVEPYDLIFGEEANYVLSNFCPSITENQKARKLPRYKKGEDFLNLHRADTSLSFFTALSDTMHVCRSRNGDGTLLTSIWDSQKGLVNLYFYHDYDSTFQFNIAEELAKGDHIYDLVSLFPSNAEFQKFSNYITPFNTPPIRILLVILGGILLLFSLFYLVIYIRKKAKRSYLVLISMALLNLLSTFYFAVLATNIYIYYFDAPYQHYSSNLITASSYIPFILLIGFIPIAFHTLAFVKKQNSKGAMISLLGLNHFIYLLALFAFGYWGLFNFWN